MEPINGTKKQSNYNEGQIMLSSVIPSVDAKWEVKEVPTPQAGTNQVLIKIHASGICYIDVHITRGRLGVKFPYTIGHEPAGELLLWAKV
jgi:alcohol dehydrogenase